MGEGFWRRMLEKTQAKGRQKGKGQYSNWFIVALVVVGIYFMFISAMPKEIVPQIPEDTGSQAPAATQSIYQAQLEHDLQAALKSIKGVKDVHVVVNLASGPMYDYLKNLESTRRKTEEDDGAGGTRVIGEDTTRTQTVMNSSGGGQQAVVVREVMPSIAGVMVTVKGDGGMRLLEDVTYAVSTALNLPAHRVKVLQMD